MYTIQTGVNVTSNSKDNFFSVDANQGDVAVAKKPLPVGRHTIFVEAADQPVNPTERRFSLAVITIYVISSGTRLNTSTVGLLYYNINIRISKQTVMST